MPFWAAIRWSAAGPSKDVGFRSIFDGQTLKGWHASAQTGHSSESGNKSGGRWVVENGAIVGSQDIPGNGGIFLTDEQFGDYEVVLEMKNDFGPDSGLFLRCDEKGTCYQAMIDYHVGGNLMGLYGEGGLGAKPNLRNFTFLDRPDHITLVTEVNNVPVPVPFPMPLEDWPTFWKHGQWNELRAGSSATRRISPPGSRMSSSWTGRRPRSVIPTRAASGCRSTAAAISPSSSSAFATSASSNSTSPSDIGGRWVPVCAAQRLIRTRPLPAVRQDRPILRLYRDPKIISVLACDSQAMARADLHDAGP